MIRIEDLHFSWPGGAALFSGLTMALSSASVVAVLGPNGMGKSTLLRLIAGLEQPDRGRIDLAGLDSLAGRALARKIGAVMQNSDRHFLRSSVLEEVATGSRLLGLPDPLNRAGQALARLQIADLADKHPLDLDAGAARLVSLASAIAHGPQVLLLDEVQRGLDRRNRARLEAAIAAEATGGATVLLVSHDADFVRRLADHAIIFSVDGIELKRMR